MILTTIKTTLLGLALVFVCATAYAAAEVAQVEALQKDAWVKRGTATFPATPGMALFNGDILRTGAEARLIVILADKSLFKLGEYAEAKLENLQPKPEKNLLSGALSILKGAFRFTSQVKGKRDVTIKVKAITVGIRGTDLWGRAGFDKDLACLLEGQIEVSSGGVSHVLDKPLQGFVVPNGKTPLPVQMLDEAKVTRWAQQTELQ
jgi:hypothetical protein